MKIFRYFIFRFIILCIPIIFLILALNYGSNNSEHRTDRGLGVAILSGEWLVFYFIIMIIEMFYRIVKKKLFG